jgi:hypothetical protein
MAENAFALSMDPATAQVLCRSLFMDMRVMTWMFCGNLLPPFAEASESPESTTQQVRWPDTQNLSSILTQGFRVADHGTAALIIRLESRTQVLD